MGRMVGVADDDDEREYDIDDNDVQFYVSKGDAGTIIDPDPFADPAIDVKESLSGLSSNQKRKITTMTKRFDGKNDTGTKGREDNTITGYDAFQVVSPPYNLDYLAKLYELSPQHKSAVDAKMSNIVGLGYDFVESRTTKRKVDKLSEKKKSLDNFRQFLAKAKDDLDGLLDDMNSEDEFSEILSKVWKDYECTGNGYIEIGRDTTNTISYIGHISASTIRVRRSRDGFVQIIANQAVFFRNFAGKDSNPIGNDANPNELIHIKKYAPSSTFYGVPDIIAAKEAILANRLVNDFNLDYFENKAVPRHLIILQGATINPALARNILEFFETGLKGKHHRSLFVPLPAGDKDHKVDLSIQPIETKIQDSSFNNYKKANQTEILMAHRVPVSKVSVAEGVSLAVAKDADKTFKEQVCQPEQKILEKKLNKIFKELTDLFVIKLNEMTLTDENTQSQIDERRRKTGVETANEQRARRGMPGLPGGDELVDLNAQAKQAAAAAKQVTDGNANRTRDSQRSAGATDSVGAGRNPKGEGRTVTGG